MALVAVEGRVSVPEIVSAGDNDDQANNNQNYALDHEAFSRYFPDQRDYPESVAFWGASEYEMTP